MFSTVAGALKSKTPFFVEPIASRIAKKTENYYYIFFAILRLKRSKIGDI